MAGLPLTEREIHTALRQDGWYVDRQGGRHTIFRHPTKAGAIPVPRHRTLKPGTARQIMKAAGLLPDSLVPDSLEASMRRYTIVLTPAPEGGFLVNVPALPGCFTEGDTLDEAVAMAKDVIALYIESLEAHGEPVPEEQGAPRLVAVDV